jgi:hypothetical protein
MLNLMLDLMSFETTKQLEWPAKAGGFSFKEVETFIHFRFGVKFNKFESESTLLSSSKPPWMKIWFPTSSAM